MKPSTIRAMLVIPSLVNDVDTLPSFVLPLYATPVTYQLSVFGLAVPRETINCVATLGERSLQRKSYGKICFNYNIARKRQSRGELNKCSLVHCYRTCKM